MKIYCTPALISFKVTLFAFPAENADVMINSCNKVIYEDIYCFFICGRSLFKNITVFDSTGKVYTINEGIVNKIDK